MKTKIENKNGTTRNKNTEERNKNIGDQEIKDKKKQACERK